MDKRIIGPQVISSALIEKNNKFLLVFCPRFKTWRVPGGRVEWNETIENTLIREIQEEVEIKIKDYKFIGYGQDHQYHIRAQRKCSRLLMFFHTKTDKELKIDPDEAEKTKWVSLEEMKQEKDKEGALTDLFNKNPELEIK